MILAWFTSFFQLFFWPSSLHSLPDAASRLFCCIICGVPFDKLGGDSRKLEKLRRECCSRCVALDSRLENEAEGRNNDARGLVDQAAGPPLHWVIVDFPHLKQWQARLLTAGGSMRADRFVPDLCIVPGARIAPPSELFVTPFVMACLTSLRL